MALTKTKLISAGIIVALCIPLALLWQRNMALRRELATLQSVRNEASRPPQASSKPTELETANAERQRLRLEHLELLRLRGRVAQLANDLRQLKNAGTTGGASLNPASEPLEADSILFSAALTNRVRSGNTLVVGGWSKDGMRGYLLIRPVIRQGDTTAEAEQLSVQSQVVGAPESFWTQIGWGEAKSETRRSTLASVLTPEQADMLLQALKETKDVEISNTSLVKSRDGERVGLGFSMADDKESGVLMGIELYPRMLADGQSLDIEIRPSAVSTNAPIHPILKPVEQPSSPSAQ